MFMSLRDTISISTTFYGLRLILAQASVPYTGYALLYFDGVLHVYKVKYVIRGILIARLNHVGIVQYTTWFDHVGSG